jgi:hypothetical protein
MQKFSAPSEQRRKVDEIQQLAVLRSPRILQWTRRKPLPSGRQTVPNESQADAPSDSSMTRDFFTSDAWRQS